LVGLDNEVGTIMRLMTNQPSSIKLTSELSQKNAFKGKDKLSILSDPYRLGGTNSTNSITNLEAKKIRMNYKYGAAPKVNGKEIRMTRKSTKTHSRYTGHNNSKIDRELLAVDEESKILKKFVSEVTDYGDINFNISGLH
jgi:hypothetical protein